MNIQEAFARASISKESQPTVNPDLLLEHQDEHQSVSCHDVPASDLVNQNCSDISIPPVLESEVQTVYTGEPEPDILSQDNPELCSVMFSSFRSSTRSVCNSFCDSVPFVICKTKTR